jgi:hypothetical protein
MIAQALRGGSSMSPDKDAIHQFLSLLTKPWKECSPKGQLELRFLAKEKSASIARFEDNQLMDATDHIIKMNVDNLNAYVCINPVVEIPLKAGKGATDEDILRAHFAFADCDEPGAAERLKSSAPPHDFSVVTGMQPHLRCHYYWQFVDPVYDLLDWKKTQKAIAEVHATDGKVCNPSRVMRVAGTIAYPSVQKQEKGYVPELTQLVGLKSCQ